MRVVADRPVPFKEINNLLEGAGEHLRGVLIDGPLNPSQEDHLVAALQRVDGLQKLFREEAARTGAVSAPSKD